MKVLLTFFTLVLSLTNLTAQVPPVVVGEMPLPKEDVVAPTPHQVNDTDKYPDELIAPPDAIPATADTTIYAHVDTMPAFPGGFSAWNSYVGKTMRYADPNMDSIGFVVGTVWVKFAVEKDGAITHVEVMKSPDSKYLRDEATRIVANSPNWIPGKHNGVTVRTYVVQPIRFSHH